MVTLGDIRSQVAAVIGREPSDLAVSGAQSEIEAALDTGLPPLSDTGSNAIIQKFPGLYSFGILAHHAALTRDEQAAAIWRATFESAKQTARASLTAEQMAQRPLPAIRAPGATP